jgi:hypothetical protein
MRARATPRDEVECAYDRVVERFDCPVCGLVFEDEDGDEVARRVMEHVAANHPEWGTKKSGNSPSKSKSSPFARWKRGRS